MCCFKRFYEHNGVHHINPLSIGDAVFGDFRAALDAEMKCLHGLGFGTSSKRAEPITADEESLLWTCGQLGTHSAKALLNTVYFYNCKVFGLRCFDEHRNLMCAQYEKKVDDKGRVYTDFGNKANRGGLKQVKMENKAVRQYENVNDPDQCVVNTFVKYFDCIPARDSYFYFRPLPNDYSGLLRFGKQAVGKSMLGRLIPEMCKAAGIQGHKTDHSGKVTCATTLYQQNFSDQLIKERTGHRSLEALHKYKRTGSDQQYEVCMAPVAEKENVPDDDDFVPIKKKPKFNPGDIKAMFPQSTLSSCTFNINFNAQ